MATVCAFWLVRLLGTEYTYSVAKNRPRDSIIAHFCEKSNRILGEWDLGRVFGEICDIIGVDEVGF